VREVLLGLLKCVELALHALGGSSGTEVPGVVFGSVSAVTLADPHGLPVATSTETDDGQLAEGLVEKVNADGTWNSSTVARHDSPISLSSMLFQERRRPALQEYHHPRKALTIR
jgi:hypothetical protein